MSLGILKIYGIHNLEFLGEDTIIDLNKEFSDYLKDGQSNLIIGNRWLGKSHLYFLI